jgi:hypothetical protein
MKKLLIILLVTSTVIFAVTYIVVQGFRLGSTHEEVFEAGDPDFIHERFGDEGQYYDPVNHLYEYNFSFTTRFIQTGRVVNIEEHPFDTLNQTYDHYQVINTTTYPKGRNITIKVKFDQYGKCSHRWYAQTDTHPITKQLTRIHF